jgi:prepilin-type N-terminal cleavage/methylation domain-containing protein
MTSKLKYHDFRSVRIEPQTGFTIIELVVAIAIFTIVLGAVYGVLELGRNSRLNAMQRSEVLQNVRIALNTIGRDALNSGVGYPNQGALIPDDRLGTILGIARDPDSQLDSLTPVVPGNNVNVIGGTATDELSVVYTDDSFNGDSGLPVDEVKLVGGGVRAQLNVGGGLDTSPCSPGDLYMVTGQTGYAIVQATSIPDNKTIELDRRDPLDIHDPDPGVSSPLMTVVPDNGSCGLNCMNTAAALTRIRWITYLVVDDGTGAGTLVRRVYGGWDPVGRRPLNWTDQPLAFGVENLQVIYVLQNGSVVDSPAADEMQDIRQVRVSVSVRSPEVDPKTNQPYRSVLTASFSTRNLVYEKQ